MFGRASTITEETKYVRRNRSLRHLTREISIHNFVLTFILRLCDCSISTGVVLNARMIFFHNFDLISAEKEECR